MKMFQILAVPCREATIETEGAKAGMSLAAEAFLDAGLVDEIVAMGAEVAGIERPQLAAGAVGPDKVVNLGNYNALIASAVSNGLADGAQPLLAGGTCNHLIGMVAGLQQHYGATARLGLLWFDAHGDFNTPGTTMSGMLGGMPVAVTAGLCHPEWRQRAGQLAPLPTNRIVMVDVRNLDAAEEQLIRSTDVAIARFGEDWDPAPIEKAIEDLAERVDHLYLHIDADILDASLQPNHSTAEPNGPDLAQTMGLVRHAMQTGKVRAFAVVSVDPTGGEGTVSLQSGMAMLREGVQAWIAAKPEPSEGIA